MRRLTWCAAAFSALIASVLASGADDAWQPWTPFDVGAESSWPAAYGDPALKIDPGTSFNDAVRVRDPIQLFGPAGHYLYDMDAWQAVSRGPIIGPLRQRTYSLFGADTNGSSLNRLTMGSEAARRDAGASQWRGSWSNPGWSF